MSYRIFFALLLLIQLPAAAARGLSNAEIQQLKAIITFTEQAPAGTLGTNSLARQQNYLNSIMQQWLEAGVSLQSLIRAILTNASDLQSIGVDLGDDLSDDNSAQSLAAFLAGVADPAQLAVAMMEAGYSADEAVAAVAQATATPLQELIADSQVAAAMADSERAGSVRAAAPDYGKGAPVLLLQNAASPS